MDAAGHVGDDFEGPHDAATAPGGGRRSPVADQRGRVQHTLFGVSILLAPTARSGKNCTRARVLQALQTPKGRRTGRATGIGLFEKNYLFTRVVPGLGWRRSDDQSRARGQRAPWFGLAGVLRGARGDHSRVAGSKSDGLGADRVV